MRWLAAGICALTLAACNEADQAPDSGLATAPPQEDARDTPQSSAADETMTPVDPGGLTEDGFVFQTQIGAKHLVRLPAPGADTWRAATSGEPTVKQIAVLSEAGPDGKPTLVFQYEMLEAGSVAVEFERLEDGEVEGKRTITFTVR